MKVDLGRDLSLLERQMVEDGKQKRWKFQTGLMVGAATVFVVYFVLLFRSTEVTFAVRGTRKYQATPAGTPLDPRRCELIAKFYDKCKTSRLMPTEMDFESGNIVCDFDVVKELDYVPSKEMIDCLEVYKPTTWTMDAEAFQTKISKLQNPENCDHPFSSATTEPSWTFGTDKNGEKMRVPGMKKKSDPTKPKWELVTWLNHGWAYNLFVLAFNSANHWANDIPILASNSKYRFSDNDCGRGWSCSLSPLSQCKVETVKESAILVFGIGESRKSVMTLDQLCKPHGYYEKEFGRCNCDYGFLPAADSRYFYCKPYSSFDFSIDRKVIHRDNYEQDKRGAIEGRGEVWFSINAPGEENPHNTFNSIHFQVPSLRRKHGYLWYHAQALFYLMKDARKKEKFEKQRELLGLTTGKCLAIHVRHGDACHDVYQNHRVCLPLSKFVAGARTLEREYGKFDKVFIATDDPGVIADIPKFSNEFNFVYQKQDRSFYETGDKNGVDVRPEFNEVDKVDEITSDIWIMSHCDAFVGSFASSVAWVAYEYMTARSGHFRPFVSVDLPYGHEKNVGRFFEDDEHVPHE